MQTLLNNLDIFVAGFRETFTLFAGASVVALVLGTTVGGMRVAPVTAVRAWGTIYVNVIRNTPLTLLMFFFAFGYPKLGLPVLSYTTLAISALGIYTASYVAEVLRSGINTVPVGQAEAARALGLGFRQSLSLVILPQAFRTVIPPMMSVFIALLKNTTIAAGFSVAEAGAIRANLSERGEPALIVLLWVGLVFALAVSVLSLIQRRAERVWTVAR
jgi:glutamate transport system permease protein